MRNVLLLKTANHFDDHSATALVVSAEDSRAIGADNVALDDRLDAFARDDRVHVRAHHDRRRARNRAGKPSDHVAAVAADFFASVVNLDLRAHLLAVLLDSQRHLALFARVTIDLNEFEQKILDAFLVDHWASEFSFRVPSL